MRIRKIIISLSLAPLLCVSVFSQTPESKSLPPTLGSIPTVDFCDLTVHPKLYVGKLVRVKATFIWWWESSYLYDSQCETSQKKIHNGLDCSGGAECERLGKEVYDYFREAEIPHTIGPAYRSDLTIIGRLVGPKKPGFGHLNSFRFEFRIRKVELASPVVTLHP